jgi:16S rRNA (guanine527-N7)-methyltransferase
MDPEPRPGSLPDEWYGTAEILFGDRLPLAERYAELLATDGVVRGLIGPREAPRIWDRHVLNCAVVGPLIPPSAYVADVGSGAGLPGLVLAIARPDIRMVLVEPLSRRTIFLDEAVDALGLEGQVAVLRARAEEATAPGAMFHVKHADVVTARAVAPLDRLAAWCLPFVGVGGRLLAMKGSSAAEEIAEHASAVARLGGGPALLHTCGADLLDSPTWVVEVIRERAVSRPDRAARASSGRRPR